MMNGKHILVPRVIACIFLCAAFSAQATTYYLTGSDAWSASSMSGTTSDSEYAIAGWATTPGGTRVADGATAGNDYVVTQDGYMRGPVANGATANNYTFAGDSLTYESGRLLATLNGGKVLTIADLRVAAGGYLNYFLTRTTADSPFWRAD